MITQQDIDTLTQRLNSLEATVKQLAESLVLTNQNLAKTEEKLEKHMAKPHYIPAKSTDAAAMYKTVSKTMTEATNTEVKLHGGTPVTPESVHRFFT